MMIFDCETILQSAQDTLYLLTLDEYAPSFLLPRISHTSEWPTLVLKLINRTIGSGIATLLTYRDVSFDDAMRSLVQHPIVNKHDDGWHGFQLASTDQALAMIAALGIFDLDQPTTDAMRIQAAELGVLSDLTHTAAIDDKSWVACPALEEQSPIR